MRRERLFDIAIPLVAILLSILPAWFDLTNYCARGNGWTFWLLSPPVPAILGFFIYAAVMRRWMRAAALAVILALCAARQRGIQGDVLLEMRQDTAPTERR